MRYLKCVSLPLKEVAEDENLYDDIDLTENDIVEAQYWGHHGYPGNPDICALPRYASLTEIKTQNSIPLRGYDEKKAREMPLSERKIELLRLKDVRIPFPFHGKVDMFLNTVMVSAYASRKLAITDRPMEYDVGSGVQKSNIITAGTNICSNTMGFSIIGASGSGKSTAFQLASAKYPRAIRHHLEGISYVQIPIIRLTAFANGNLSALYYMFASQLDEILDSGDLHYRQMKGGTNLGKMTAVVEDWIKRYHIGVIAIDEIQLMDFSPNSAKSIENLLTITAMTGVALIMIGTQDACSCWNSVLRLQRRTQSLTVRADEYCRQKEYVELLIKRIWKYQWLSKKAELTDGIMEALYEESQGSIDLLTTLWMMIQFEAISMKKEAEINEEFIHKIAGGEYGRMKALLKESLAESEKKYMDLKRSLMDQIQMSADADEQKRYMDSLRADNEKKIRQNYDRDMVLGNLIEIISCCHPEYSDTMIRKTFQKAEKNENFAGMSKSEKTKAVLGYLEKPKKRANTTRKPAKPPQADEEELDRLEKELESSLNLAEGIGRQYEYSGNRSTV